MRPSIGRGCDRRKDHGLRPNIGRGCDCRKDHEMSLGWHICDPRVITIGKLVCGILSQHVDYIIALLIIG